MHLFTLLALKLLWIFCRLLCDLHTLRLRQRFPRMSNEEFVLQCGAFRPDVAIRVREILADTLGMDDEDIHPQMGMQDLNAC